ncbi:hypothetical protein KRX54_03700 [Actinomycetaceae bacterium TAE3-ERU4]|nr:hypothetical protein [Actinomycetaceae bacterium TAE3-ERU4]
MERCKKYVIISALLFSLSGCTAQGNTDEKNALASPEKTTTEKSTTLPKNLDEEIHTNPREGGVKEYLQKENAEKYATINSEWESFTSLKGEVSINWSEINEATFIPVCNSKSGKFILYKNGKNIAEGKCGPGQVNSFSPPRLNQTSQETFSFEIVDATKSEVAVFKEKIQK